MDLALEQTLCRARWGVRGEVSFLERYGKRIISFFFSFSIVASILFDTLPHLPSALFSFARDSFLSVLRSSISPIVSLSLSFARSNSRSRSHVSSTVSHIA